MDRSEKGYVYILTNPSFREDWVKIGKSTRPVNVRSKELDNTAVPLPFEIFATLETKKYHEVEKLVHKTIDRLTDLRIRQNREFFNVAPQIALDIFMDIAVTIDDAKIVQYRDNKPIEEEARDHRTTSNNLDASAPPRRSRFKFSTIGVKVGEYITFTPTNLQVRVAGDDSIEYEGRIYKLSPFVSSYMPKERRNNSGTYQGAKYFTYQGKVLADLRNERERIQNAEIAKQEKLSPILRLQHEFWEAFREHARGDAEFLKVFTLPKAQPQNWYTLRIGSTTSQIHLTADTRKKHIGSELYIHGDKALFHRFKAEHLQLTHELGAAPSWIEANKDCRMAIFYPGDISNRTAWPQYFSWLRQTALLIRTAYKRRV